MLSLPERVMHKHGVEYGQELPHARGEGGQADEGRDLPTAQGAQFRQARQEGEGRGWSDTGDALEQVLLLPPQGACAKARGQVGVQLLQLLLESGEEDRKS